MSEEIKKLDMDKYLVIKNEDLDKYLGDEFKSDLYQIEETINLNRRAEGKQQNQYLVLNLDDEIDMSDLLNRFENNFGLHSYWGKEKVKDIAVALVNAILKAKGD